MFCCLVSCYMKFIQGQDRTQTHLFPVSLDQTIDRDNQVRLIDLFVDKLDLQKLGFQTSMVENGRPAYHPSILLKLYIYGYMNRIRSSRCLEKECKRNIEVMWLIQCLCPDHNTIANFRRDNSRAIKKVFRETVRMASYFDLIGGKLVAGDSTKLRAQNSKKNNFNQKKINRHLEYIENKLAEYEKELADSDGDKREELKKEISKQEQRQQNYRSLEQQLKESGQTQISTSDPDSRHLITRNNITEVGYSLQTTVDAKNNIPVDYKITNNNDKKAMGNMLRRAKTILRTSFFTALYDKGYHTGSELAVADTLNIPVIVAIPPFSGASHAPNLNYDTEHFDYNPLNDTYTCLQGHTLSTTGYWHKVKNNAGEVAYRFKNYTTPLCKTCAVRPLCTKSAVNGKQVRRSEFAGSIENNKKRVRNSEKLYKRRQAIVEHPFGTIKRQWGFNYIITKKFIERAEADSGFILIAYNLKRIINCIGNKQFQRYITCFAGLFYVKINPETAYWALNRTFLRKIGKIIDVLMIFINQRILTTKMNSCGSF